MVLMKKKLDNGFNDHRSPTIPRGPRSLRKRQLCRKSPERGGICAFDLLATVAGKLLEESECSSASSSAACGFDRCGVGKVAVMKELQDVDKPLVGEHDEQGSSEGSIFFSGIERDLCKRKLDTMGEVPGELAFSSVKVDSDSKLLQKSFIVELADSMEGDFPKCEKSDDTDVGKIIDSKLEITGETSEYLTVINKSPAPANSNTNVELLLCRDSNPIASFPRLGNDVKLDCKDDDEILSFYSQPKSAIKACKSPTHTGYRKLRKLITSKCWKAAPKLKADYEFSNAGDAVKHIHHKKRYSYELNRSQRDTPFKKRKLFNQSSVVTYEGGISCESVSNSPVKSIDAEKNASAGKLHEGNGMSSSAFGHLRTRTLRGSHVRLSINSFKVPELTIEVPECTTVCSLKRTVLEAVTAKLGSGLRVGVLLHGKKIWDDNRTLHQAGLTRNDSDSIGFMLEPDNPSLICSEIPPIPLPCDSPKFVNRSQVNPTEDMLILDTPDKSSVNNPICPGGNRDNLVHSPTADHADKNDSDYKPLVSVPEACMDALAMVPVDQKPRRSDIGPRRARRPFSVSEVEALVEAVERIGTGRWRDVKLCAFENAKHRTYVDLKDKWKTLVHTARISPQQRRGEPVPQELLDRVLAAQVYWSEHQTKQHGKQQRAIIPKLLTDTAAVKA